jgi:hypothetical protein
MEAFVGQFGKARLVAGETRDGVSIGEKVRNQLLRQVAAGAYDKHGGHDVRFVGAYLNACSSALVEQGFKACLCNV